MRRHRTAQNGEADSLQEQFRKERRQLERIFQCNVSATGLSESNKDGLFPQRQVFDRSIHNAKVAGKNVWWIAGKLAQAQDDEKMERRYAVKKKNESAGETFAVGTRGRKPLCRE
ncbi:hypothetical protein TGME49_214860 [Toxoplasma gondii ME49]|uniref:Uncharacterized protein n=1 Tax=Toxoplasma gondii (strain ATCC 50611 / Me49) TaxID=508771 RepID=S8EVX1_TOXGM|nr:hypothetical protein TGME49_214860 [Toxoplasma gondii ME49]EPT26507.1 hypothetical protein TGME49_214860 [Toxoplasma gondii ME49]|eukprot:XP_002370807.1 hypothetical protein TGME49_214860 [Toxoplasma gondii ME49]